MYRTKKTKESSAEGAYKTALNLLARADHTVSALRRKLHDRGFEDEHIDAALAALSKEGLLNELRHLQNKALYYAEVCLYGKNRIRLELMNKGFERYLLDQRLDEVLEGIDFEENCLRLALKKRMSAPKTRQDVQKFAASLQRYGYANAAIRSAIEQLRHAESE